MGRCNGLQTGKAGLAVVPFLFLILFTVEMVVGAPEEDLIRSLPGQPKVTFKQYGGFVTVDSKNGRALYYYFVEAETNADVMPLTLWLNGGQ
jgi:serine carboxypeptidase-like clade 2